LIKKLSILTHHILLLTEEGELYGWGSNEYQRLGFDESIKIVEEPKLLNFFNNKERFIILDIAAGDDHSLIYVEEKDNNKNSSFKRLY
jgi:alpha-tubulin suppressor-like RCC1 family protein